MESNFDRREFEDFIQESADQYRMFPSEKVWNKINSTLHTRRKWYGAGLATLLIATVSAVTWVMLTNPITKTINKISALRIDEKAIQQTSPEEIQQVISFEEPAKRVTRSIPGPSITESPNPLLRIGFDDLKISTLLLKDSPASSFATDQRQLAPSLGFIDQSKLSLSLIDPIIPETVDRPVEQAAKQFTSQPANEIAYSVENVTNSFRVKGNGKKLKWQVFFTPTISYRSLHDNKLNRDNNSLAVNTPFIAVPNENVKQAVTHKPDLGLELGFNASYPLTHKINLRSGLQFNIRKYDIKAYAYRGELANIDLNGTTSPTRTWTYYRTTSGFETDWLKNYYLTVSLPVGAEIKLLKTRKTTFGVAGTVQPTYVLSDRAYLLSTDYKNYAEVPSLVRHMNLNTSFETFISYRTGKTEWQVGPQLRYQILSSFQHEYPVKENLFDFGVKVAMTLNNR